MAADVPEGLADAANVLVLGPADNAVGVLTGECFPAVVDGDANFLCMTFTRDPEEWLDGWRAGVGGDPARAGLIGVGESIGPEGSTGLPELDAEEAVSTERVADPSDLPRLGITLSEFLTRWGDETPTVVAFDSVSALLQYADLQRVYRFLHTLKGRLQSVDAVAFYHLDPAAHDDQTIATLRPLFDTVLEVGADGTLTVA
jgi:hypothetical protein